MIECLYLLWWPSCRQWWPLFKSPTQCCSSERWKCVRVQECQVQDQHPPYLWASPTQISAAWKARIHVASPGDKLRYQKTKTHTMNFWDIICLLQLLCCEWFHNKMWFHNFRWVSGVLKSYIRVKSLEKNLNILISLRYIWHKTGICFFEYFQNYFRIYLFKSSESVSMCRVRPPVPLQTSQSYHD